MNTRPIGFALLLNCALATLICGEVRGGIVELGTDDVVASTAVFTLEIFDPYYPGGFTETLSLESGPFAIERDQQLGDGDGSFSSRIDTEIESLTFDPEISVYVGPLVVRIGGLNGVQEGPTLGQINFVISNPFDTAVVVPKENFQLGQSSFDVLFEVDAAGMTLYNRDPHVLEAPNITSLPPIGSVHLPPVSPGLVKLYLRQGSNNDISDPWVGWAGGTHKLIAPEPSSLALLGLGCLGLFSCRRRSRKHRSAN